MHSVFSDGLKTPDELCAMAAKAGVAHIALCDHDSVNGLPAMREAAAKHGLSMIPGVEISTGKAGKMHILCYGENVESPQMKAFLESMAQERTGRAAAMMEKLAYEGIHVPEERRAELLAMPSVGRAHIARELIAMGVVNTMPQAFDRWLLEGRPAYVPRAELATAQTVEKLRAMRVVPVLTHPMRSGLEPTALHAFLHSLIECGLAGVEAWHPSANARAARVLDRLSRQENLLVTGGSDYHGDSGSTVRIGHLPAGWPARQNDLSALKSAISHC
ncbi:MAG: PHP domain-containing protein [Clostridia bacterium]|nr:PHP domain-containing protein [Clostridia bacterium]